MNKYFVIAVLVLISACDRSSQVQIQGYVEGENLYLASPYSGVLVKKCVTRGQRVVRGEPIFQLDSEPEALQVKQHEAELQQAKKVLMDLQKPRRPEEIKAIQDQIQQIESQRELAALRVKRFETLRTKGAIDKDSVDAAVAHLHEVQHQKEQFQANLDLANQGSRSNQIQAQQAAVDAAEAALQQSQWQLAQKSIMAPVDGEIFDTYYLEGEFVPAQQAVASLLSAETLRIEFFVPVRVMNQLALGQTITFTCEAGTKANAAVINYISPEAEYIPPLVYSEANTDKLVYRIKAAIVNPGGFQFKPGQPVMVRFHVV